MPTLNLRTVAFNYYIYFQIEYHAKVRFIVVMLNNKETRYTMQDVYFLTQVRRKKSRERSLQLKIMSYDANMSSIHIIINSSENQ